MIFSTDDSPMPTTVLAILLSDPKIRTNGAIPPSLLVPISDHIALPLNGLPLLLFHRTILTNADSITLVPFVVTHPDLFFFLLSWMDLLLLSLLAPTHLQIHAFPRMGSISELGKRPLL
jgi:hypothetical protein